MKQNLLETKINQTIQEFENLSNFEPSPDWNEILMDKISSKQSNSSAIKYAVLIAFLLLINISFLILYTRKETVSETSQKSQDLKNISNELLISPNSTKE
jgi:hypothetical protein